MSAKIRFESHADIVLKKVSENAQAAVKAVGSMLVEAVQEKMLYGYHDPHGKDGHTEIVDTGKLFDSIEAEERKESQNTYSSYVGTDVPYAKFVHDGTYKLKGRPFLRDGIMDNTEKIEETMAKEMKNGFTN